MSYKKQKINHCNFISRFYTLYKRINSVILIVCTMEKAHGKDI